MLHDMRSIVNAEPRAPVDVADADAILTEVAGWMADLRCASMGRLVQGHVSLSQMHVLWLLQHHGAMSMSRLAELLDVSMSNATGLIDRMEEHGLIERVRVPDDRRIVLVRPAAAGVKALFETETSKREGMRGVIGRLPPSERAIVLAAFRSLRRALSAEVESTVHQHHFADVAH
jgi:DNA-binding MarR family transcriptional regulator